jgi:tight adherence protein B
VVEVCEALAGELRAGQPPLPALRHCAEVWPPLVEAATAAELGSDVVRALHRLAEAPGAAGLHEVAAAWQVSQRSGGTMAPALGSVADSARRRRATERLVASELASAQATARLIAVLPVVVLAMGAGLGGDSWGFLLTTPAGIGCLAAGLALAFLGLSWIERIATSAVRA